MARDAAASERARKDPAAGPGGVAALVLVVAVEVAALAALAVDAGTQAAALALVTAASVGRAVGPVVAAVVARATRSPDPGATPPGAGGWFVGAVSVRDAVAAVGTAVVIAGLSSLAVGLPSVAAGALVGGVLGLAIALAVVRARRGLDGDGLGAAIELTTAAVLASTAVLAAISALASLGAPDRPVHSSSTSAGRAAQSGLALARTRALAGDGRACSSPPRSRATRSSTGGSGAIRPTGPRRGRPSTSARTSPPPSRPPTRRRPCSSRASPCGSRRSSGTSRQNPTPSSTARWPPAWSKWACVYSTSMGRSASARPSCFAIASSTPGKTSGAVVR
jgi:hypothetical protein